jgi:predicted MFS family arabinose efflux permease
MLCGIYIGTALFSAFLVLVFLNTYKQIGMTPSQKQFASPVHLLANTIKHIKNKNQLLIIPLTLWSGFEQAFIGADFTKSYISCVKGVNQVGLVMICFGVADTLGSYGFGYAIKYIGRIPCFLVAAGLNYLSLGLLIFWQPSLESSYVLYIIAVLWGLADAV